MELINMLVADIRPYEKNAKSHPKSQIEAVAKSIKEFGFNQPLVVDNNNVLIVGHGRLEAAKLLGMTEAPVFVANNLTEAQVMAYRLADNKLNESDWDMSLVLEELGELDDMDFDISLTGFKVDLIAEPEEKDDKVPEAPKEPKSKLGDIYQLGDHRLMCGDSTNIEHFEKLMNGQSPNTMITDPPYGVEYEADWRAKAKGVAKTEREESSNLKNDDKADWYDAYSLFQGSVAYVWHASAFTDVVMDGLRRSGFDIKQQIIWNKNVHALSRSDYHWKHEPCWYAVRPNGDRNWNGGRKQKTVWDIDSVIYEKGKTAHPTQKPLEIYTRPLEFHTNKGEYVYDPFGGSGSLIIACEKLGRRGLSMELDPKYVDVIIQRWEDYTGEKAIKLN